MSGRFVVGVGGTDPVDAAEAWAAAHASLSGSRVVRVHVGAPEPGTARSSADTPSDVVFLSGAVPEALADFVRDEDILVIGTGKTGFIRSRVFGTLSLQIAAEARCGVAVIPRVDLRFRRGIVAGVKDDEVLPAIVHAAADEANAREETLQLIHSSGEGLVPAPIEIGGPVLDRAAAMAVERAPNARLRIRASERPPAEALLDASRNASLLVIGAGHPRGAGHALGAVTHDVLVNINAPVLVVRPTA
ncbi:universal stress protein [Microbacterium luteolum]|uniref:Universal stress protein n=1 Tax=Microbacterium luteolum TaxID=69367 RepID=A0ABY7XKF5_MICLT|nr:universal stress protein [Microbacterium luteolum]WDM42600.1 universal stress protein [Microbacterium luteolum]